jgi:hypothetical protein
MLANSEPARQSGEMRRILFIMARVFSPIWKSLFATMSDAAYAYARELQGRPKLGNGEFYQQFYADGDVPKELVTRLRTLFESIFGDDLSSMWPHDNLALIYDSVDFADVLFRVGREFKVAIPISSVAKEPLTYRGKACRNGQIDGTFDSLVRYLAKAKPRGDPEQG